MASVHTQALRRLNKHPSAFRFRPRSNPLLLLTRTNFADLPFLVNGTGPCSGTCMMEASENLAQPLAGAPSWSTVRVTTKN
jgi:hypothetical protein